VGKGQRESGLWAFLSRPSLYRLVNRFLGPGANLCIGAAIDAELGTSGSGLHLDLGCGPDSRLAPSGVALVGVDASLAYARALHRGGQRAVVALVEALPFRPGSFAGAWSFGLLHHLSEQSARSALQEAERVVKGGKVVVLDGVLPERSLRRPLAWLVRRLDRGRFMRDEAALRGLLGSSVDRSGPSSPHAPVDGRNERWRVRRLTYAWTGLEALWCVLE
jgi:SAM-dependent methyltransferase